MTKRARLAFMFLVVCAACAAPAAQKTACEGLEHRVQALEAARAESNEETQKKLDYLILKLEGLEKRVMAQDDARPAGLPDRKRPDGQAVYAIDLTGAQITGAPSALVTIVMGYEFACPYCARVQPTIDQIVADYAGQVRVAHLSYVVHPQMATWAAKAACAAQRQGQYESYARTLFTVGFPDMSNGGLDEAHLLGYARSQGLDERRFKTDMYSDDCKRQIEEQQARLAAVGTTGTPAFYINGRFLSGARPIEQFKEVIDEELQKAQAKIGKGGVTAQNYYQKVVFEGGLKKL